MAKAKRERTLKDNEAQAVLRMVRISPQKLNLVATMIRGKKVSAALVRLLAHGYFLFAFLSAAWP